MKLSKIIAAGISTIAISAIMSISAYAATEFRTGEPTYVSEYDQWAVPIEIKSSDYTELAVAKFEVGYDTSKYTHEAGDLEIKAKSGKTVAGTAASNQGVDGIEGCRVSWASGKNITLKEDSYTVLMELYFTPSTSETPTIEDFTILRVMNLSYVGSDNDPVSISVTESGTYVIYKFPKEVTDSWTDGYIQALNAVVKKDGSELGTTPITNYYEDGDDYAFVLKLVPKNQTGKITVDIDIQASLSTKKDTPEAQWTSKVIETINGVVVEKLQ